MVTLEWRAVMWNDAICEWEGSAPLHCIHNSWIVPISIRMKHFNGTYSFSQPAKHHSFGMGTFMTCMHWHHKNLGILGVVFLTTQVSLEQLRFHLHTKIWFFLANFHCRQYNNIKIVVCKMTAILFRPLGVILPFFSQQPPPQLISC